MLRVERFLKQHGVPYKETLLFAFPEEVGIEEEDIRLVEIEEADRKVFWFQGFNFRTVEQDFFSDEVPVESKQWNPYKHQMEEGIEPSTLEEYQAYVAAKQSKLIDVQDYIATVEASKKAKRREVLAQFGFTEEQISVLID